jgi:hypothetical protein
MFDKQVTLLCSFYFHLKIYTLEELKMLTIILLNLQKISCNYTFKNIMFPKNK